MRGKLTATLFMLGLGLLAGAEALGQTQVDIGASVGPEGLRSFYFSIHEYFRVPEREVLLVRERRIPDEEISVVFFIAQRAHVPAAGIIDLRLAGRSWIDITLSFGLSPEIFYVPVKAVVTGPPYGRAYGYYRNKPRKEWTTVRLADEDVVNLVNLSFISKHYKYPVEEVIKMRSAGKGFKMIHEEVRAAKGKGKKKVSPEPKKKQGNKKKKS
jgi:hypothetical protein